MSQPNEPWRDERVLQKLHVNYGYSYDEVADILGCCAETVNRWANRLDIQGRKKAEYSDAELLNGLKKFKEEIGHVPTSKEMENDGPYSVHAYTNHFGSYNSALEKLNMKRHHENNKYKDEWWYNKEKLKDMYVEKRMSTYKIANKVGATAGAVWIGLRDFGIERRTNGGYDNTAKHRDEKWLREKYVEYDYNIGQLAREAGVKRSTIKWNMKKYGIEWLKTAEKPPKLQIRSGYEVFRSSLNGSDDRLFHHDLIAIADGANPHKVFSPEYVVHHKNNHKLDNRHCNLELMTRGEHSSLHHKLGHMD